MHLPRPLFLSPLLAFSCLSILSALPVQASLADTVLSRTFYDTSLVKFTLPVWFGELPTAKGSFMVGELGGNIFRLEPSSGGGLASSLFAHIPAALVSGNDGLLGLAFHPDFKANRKYYVYYISAPGESILEERMAGQTSRKDSGTSRILLRQTFKIGVHNGGDIHFGPDGFLYLGLGDAGNPLVFNARSQDLHLLPGKMLRIDVNRKDTGLEYGIPADNPFAENADPLVRKEIYATGLRNPWRWNFDPIDGRLILADVGDWVQEEVDIIRNGGNYGWSRMEGNTCFNGDDELSPIPACDTAGLTPPVAVLAHVPVVSEAKSSITGGYVFRGDPTSPFYGAYIFGDYIRGKLFGLFAMGQPAQELRELGTAPCAMSSFGTDSEGNIYMVGYDTGVIYKLGNPGLVGKGVAINRRNPASKPKLLLRQGRGWRIDAASFPKFESLRIFSLDGKLLLTMDKSALRMGGDVDFSPGLYLAQGSEGPRMHAFPLLLGD